MNVKFTDPVTSGYLIYPVSRMETASQCIERMIDEGCLAAGRYHLVVNGSTMLPDQTFGEAGITDNGTVSIQEIEQGAFS